MNLLTGFSEEVGIKKIRYPKLFLRDELGPLDELIASIVQSGLLQSIIVRPVEDGFEVVAGCRRLEACRRLHWSRVPCHIIELDDKEAFETSLIENVQRRTLNALEEAKAFKKYVDDYGYGSVSALAKKISKSQEYVSSRIQLLKLPAKVREEVIRRLITPSAAQELCKLDFKSAVKIGDIIYQQNLSVKEVRKILKYDPYTNHLDDTLHFPQNEEHTSSTHDKKVHQIDRALNRSIASLKICLWRMSDTIEQLENEWILKELLMQHRVFVNDLINTLLKYKKRMKKLNNIVY